MKTTVDTLAGLELPALGTTASILVTQRKQLAVAAEVLREELVAVDAACSRFRPDSEISLVAQQAGRPVVVGPLLAEALEVALRAARLTDGLVDPTVGQAVCELGYDRDFEALTSAVRDDQREPPGPTRPAPGWWRVRWDLERREVLLPRGVLIDLGATAKALAADHAATRAAERAGCGVLVSLGGDIAVAGDPPDGDWRVAVADDHRTALSSPEQTVAIESGGLATSSTAIRTWPRAGRRHHHIIDPRTGANPAPVWRTVTVAAASCVDANVASTAAVVLGEAAPAWLTRLGLPARLIGPDERVTTTAGWPQREEGV